MSIDYRSQCERLEQALAQVLPAMHEHDPRAQRARAVLDEHRREVRRERQRQEQELQGSLFGSKPTGAPYRPHVQQDTSLEAAHDLGKQRAETIRMQVLAALRLRPQTDQELAARLKIEGNTLRPRRIELCDRGLVRDSGRRALTKHKRQAIVWEAVPVGGVVKP